MTGSELAERRKKAGLTQDQLAAYLGVGRTSVWRLETGSEEVSRLIFTMAMTVEPGNPVFEKWLTQLTTKSKQMVLRRQFKRKFQAVSIP